ncbi:MAG: glycosyltransferase family 2 protein [Pseudoxanthomonas sp.]
MTASTYLDDVSMAGRSHTDQILVSIIMPVFNAERTMRQSIESVLQQSEERLELVLIDDASTDHSARIIEEYELRDGRIKVLRQSSNAGVAEARNAGIRAASGRYIAFLDSDDWWHPRKLELQIGQMQASGATVSYTAYQRVAEDGNLLSIVEPPQQVDHEDMLCSNHIGNLTGVYDRRLGDVPFLRMGHEDYVFWLDRVRRAGRAIRVKHDGPLAFYLVRNGSISSNKFRAACWQWKIYRDTEQLSLPNAAWHMLHYVSNAMRKRKAQPI